LVKIITQGVAAFIFCATAIAESRYKAGEEVSKEVVCETLLAETHTINRLDLRGLYQAPGVDNLYSFEDPRNIPNDHEWQRTIKYARHLRASNEKIVFIASYKGRSVPGFDGLILDDENNVIANYSLKTTGTKTNFYGRVREGIHRARQCSSSLRVMLNTFNLWVDEDVTTIPSEARANSIDTAFNWANRIIGLFGYKEKRPTRLVVDIVGPETETPWICNSGRIQGWVNSSRFHGPQSANVVEKVVILRGERIIEILPQTKQEGSRRLH
jgi:hypothetical protein